jgi:hypothetical protein
VIETVQAIAVVAIAATGKTLAVPTQSVGSSSRSSSGANQRQVAEAAATIITAAAAAAGTAVAPLRGRCWREQQQQQETTMRALPQSMHRTTCISSCMTAYFSCCKMFAM